MNGRLFLKTTAAFLLWRTGRVRRRLDSISRGKLGILMYHRVLPAGYPSKGLQPGMYVYTDTFERHLCYLQDEFDIVPLRNVLDSSRVESGGRRPVCSLTFDDGWVDFYELVYPLLKQYQVPATVFLPTDFIGTGEWFWTDRLGHLLYQRELYSSAHFDAEPKHPFTKKIISLNGRFGWRYEQAVSMLKECVNSDIENVLAELSSIYAIDSKPEGRAFLSWDEIREMADSGLVNFGSHTASHPILTTLDNESIQKELCRSREKLIAESVVLPDFIPFSYPNGNCNERIGRMVRDAGYSLAVATKFGWNSYGDNSLFMKRISVHNDVASSESLFFCKLAGIFNRKFQTQSY